jgi:beta-galactosidase
MAGEAGVPLLDLHEGIRICRTASHLFAFNYAAETVWVPEIGEVLDPSGWHIKPR